MNAFSLSASPCVEPVSPEILREADPAHGAADDSDLAEEIQVVVVDEDEVGDDVYTKKRKQEEQDLLTTTTTIEISDDRAGAGADGIDILELPVQIVSEEDEAATPKAAFVVKGEPGHTPFPIMKTSASASTSFSYAPSPVPPPVPFNSPDEGMLEDILRREARRQERNLRRGLEDRSLLSLFRTPEEAGETPFPRLRRKRRIRRFDADELDEGGGGGAIPASASASASAGNSAPPPPPPPSLMSRESRISPYLSEETANDKESVRRGRAQASASVLRRAVPGCAAVADRADVYEMAAKYILFLRRRVGPQHDRDFLREFMPY